MKRLIPLLLLVLIFISTSCKSDISIKAYDICIYGGTSSGIIAASTAKKLGNSVIVIEPSNHIGGMTTGGLGQTDIGHKEAVTGLSRDFYRRVGQYYGKDEAWTFEPKVASRVMNDYISEADLEIIRNVILKTTIKRGKKIKSIEIMPVDDTSMKVTTIRAKIFIDCSYEGDLMAQAGVSYTVGRESNETYNETLNGVQLKEYHQFPDSIDPFKIKGDPASGLLWGISGETLQPTGTGDKKVQAYNFRICLTDSVENLIPITKPEGYDSSRYDLLLRLISETGNTNLYSYFIWSKMPSRKTDINNRGAFSTDMIGMNYEYPDGDYRLRQEIIRQHEKYTKGLLYLFGHDPRVPENMRLEMLKWGYPKDEYIDNDHFTPQLYIREARRMIGEYIMTEHHCLGKEVVDDPAGLAAYQMDSHNCQRLVVNGMVKNEGDVQVGGSSRGFFPYPVSYRSLTPKKNECKNLLVPVCLSASHIAFGSIRMEPVFMVLGQSAAVAANLALNSGSSVQDVEVEKLQEILDKWEY